MKDYEYRIYIRYNSQDYDKHRAFAKMLRDVAQHIDEGKEIPANTRWTSDTDGMMVAFVAFQGEHSTEIGVR
jgi:hypothetical protein